MPITPEQEAQSRALLDKGNQLGQQASAQSGLAYPSTIGATQLAATPSFNIPPTPQQTESAGLTSYFENLSSATSSAKENKDDSFSSLMQSLTATQGETALTDQAYSQKGGVDNLKIELDDINQQLFGEQEGLRRQIEDIQNNAEGLSGSGMATKIDQARRASLRTQADLAVVQMAKQGRYDSAKTIADRAVSAQLEKQKQQNDIRMFMYNEYKDVFTKSEQREFEANQKERDRAYERERDNLKTISDLSLDALQNGAPAGIASKMRAAKTPEEAIQIGGQFVGKYDRMFKLAQIDNINDQIRERNDPSSKPLTIAQITALGYGQRSLQSSLIIDQVGEQFAKTGSQMWLPNFLKSDERQQFEQAQRNFINAVLRRESGAAIADSEFDSARAQYFPQPGDQPDTLIQKKLNRDLVTRNLLQAGGQDTTPQDASLSDPLQLGIGGVNTNPLNL